MKGNVATSPQITRVFTFRGNNYLFQISQRYCMKIICTKLGYPVPALFIITKDWKQPKYPSIEELLNILNCETRKKEINRFSILLGCDFQIVFFRGGWRKIYRILLLYYKATRDKYIYFYNSERKFTCNKLHIQSAQSGKLWHKNTSVQPRSRSNRTYPSPPQVISSPWESHLLHLLPGPDPTPSRISIIMVRISCSFIYGRQYVMCSNSGLSQPNWRHSCCFIHQ